MGIKEYKKTFGQLPPLMKEQLNKKRLRNAMRRDPKLRKQVLIRRNYNLKHPTIPFNKKLLKNWGFLEKSTLVRNAENAHRSKVKDPKVHLVKVPGWKDPLKMKLVREGRKKPSYRGLCKRQIKKIRKRQKMKKLAKRRKEIMMYKLIGIILCSYKIL